MNRIVIDFNNAILQRGHRSIKTGRQIFKKDSEMPTQSFIKRTIQDHSIILPQNTRYHKYYGDTQLFVTEYPPQMRTIRLEMSVLAKWTSFIKWCEKNNIKKEGQEFFKDFGSKKRKFHRFNLLFPYLVAVTLLNQRTCYYYLYLFMNPKPITNLGSMLHKVPLYNIQRSQHVCMGSSVMVNKGSIYRMPMSDAVDHIFRGVFEGSFNSDYSHNMRAYRYRENLYNPFIWAYLSQNDPFKILAQKLLPYQTLGEKIKLLERKYGYESITDKFHEMVNVF